MFLKFRDIQRETPVSESLFNKVASLQEWRPVTLFKQDSDIGVFLWMKFLTIAFFIEHFRWLLLKWNDLELLLGTLAVPRRVL